MSVNNTGNYTKQKLEEKKCSSCNNYNCVFIFYPDKTRDTTKKKKPVCLDCVMKKTRQNMIKITRLLQSTETQLDSASQKLMNKLGMTEEVKKIIFGLKSVRAIQDGYFPIQERSLKRNYDSVDKNGNYVPHLSKQNFRKFKIQSDIKKGKQSVLT